MRIHPYHLVDISPWPLQTSINILGQAFNFIFWLNLQSNYIIFIQIFTLILILFQWWRDVLRESLGGYHTVFVQKGIMIGFLLFLISEIVLFGSVFWPFFHSTLSISVELGAIWPPYGINAVNPWSLPLLGTTILLSSGFLLTQSHHYFILGNKNQSIFYQILTIILGAAFTLTQSIEYINTEFTISDSIFGANFFITTGLHAIHVIIGTIFQTVGLYRIKYDEITSETSQSLDFSIYYWHLVDGIWILVLLVYYYFCYV